MEKLRLGGMALSNGVLVHGPSSWAAAVRRGDDGIDVASGRKPRIAPGVSAPFLRGPLRLAEAIALLPAVRRALPTARFPFERPAVIGTVVASSSLAAMVRRSGAPALTREAVVAFASLAPALLALRGGELASYHGAEHVSIGSYESGERSAKEHDRCGSHLIGPLLVFSALANTAAAAAPRRYRRSARGLATVGAVGAAVEVFGWMGRHPRHPLSRALARPGHELQARVSTAEPSAAQLEVAEAALAACLAAEAASAA
jgi:uncharacterized protein YqhQ